MSSKNNNKLNIPEARAAMDKFKMEAANEVACIHLKEFLQTPIFGLNTGKMTFRKMSFFEVKTPNL